MTNAFSYACRDCEGMEACPASVTAETSEEVWQLMGHHARIAHQENPDDWDQETRDYLETLIKEVEVQAFDDPPMIVKTLEDVIGTKGEAHGNKWHSMRFLHTEDGMGVTLTDSILEQGFEMTLWQKNHLEACYCLKGEGTVEDLASGTVYEIKAGTLYAMNNHDQHRIVAKTRMRVICTFVPALTGTERHDAEGSLQVISIVAVGKFQFQYSAAQSSILEIEQTGIDALLPRHDFPLLSFTIIK